MASAKQPLSSLNSAPNSNGKDSGGINLHGHYTLSQSSTSGTPLACHGMSSSLTSSLSGSLQQQHSQGQPHSPSIAINLLQLPEKGDNMNIPNTQENEQTISDLSVSQPIAIPQGNPLFMSSVSTQPSTTTVFQQVTPFGTPSSSLSTSFTQTPSNASFQGSASSSLFSLSSVQSSKDPCTLFPVEMKQPASYTVSLLSSSVPAAFPDTSSAGLKPKIRKCPIEGCFDKVIKIVGDCKYCNSQFCSLHRLPEQHFCSQIGDLKKASFERNSDKLIKEKCVADKI